MSALHGCSPGPPSLDVMACASAGAVGQCTLDVCSSDRINVLSLMCSAVCVLSLMYSAHAQLAGMLRRTRATTSGSGAG